MRTRPHMTRRRTFAGTTRAGLILASALAFHFFAPASAAAQEIEAGTWTGTITPPGGSTLDTTFEVAVDGDAVSMIIASPIGPLPANGLEVLADRLTFSFEPGTPVDCVLMLQDDGSYTGECLDSGGDAGILVMNPPGGSDDGR